MSLKFVQISKIKNKLLRTIIYSIIEKLKMAKQFGNYVKYYQNVDRKIQSNHAKKYLLSLKYLLVV